MTTSRVFAATASLGSGRLAVEASAGTGKTFALSGLAARFLAEGSVTASELLMVTFTRNATEELRGRVRDRLVSIHDHLIGSGAEGVSVGGAEDALADWLAAADAATVRTRAANLERALTEFDSATITTIHGFAAQVLGTLGASSGVGTEIALVDDLDERVAEACTDALVRAAVDPSNRGLLPTYSTLTSNVKAASGSPDTEVLPPADAEGVDSARVGAEAVRDALGLLRRRRGEAGTAGFDDLLVLLRDALAGPTAHAVLGALRSRFSVALIDEFQDTDPVQWEIFRTLFGELEGTGRADAPGSPSLVLVGDPKQAIYSFRGADLPTYIEAVGHRATDRRSLTTNWRSDAAVLTSVAALLRGVEFGNGIQFVDVAVVPVHEHTHATTAEGTTLEALSLRLALGDDLPRNPKGQSPTLKAPEVRREIYADLAVQVKRLLDEVRLPGPNGPRPTRPSDIGVLVRSNGEAADIQAVLTGAGIPAVLARGSSVLASEAATQWRWLLEALVRPSDSRRARTFAFSWFGGRDATWLAGASDTDLMEVQEQLHGWGELLGTRGVVEFQRRVWAESGLLERLLALPDGDRCITDLEHIGELLRTAMGAAPVGAAGLLAVLDAPEVTSADTEVEGNVLSRRVESDAQAVQIMTVWVAKGLEFPIVCIPTMWSGPRPSVTFDDPATGLRTLMVGKRADLAKWPSSGSAAQRSALLERAASEEELRLLYVALTRAEHHNIVWWTRVNGSERSALGRVLYARRSDGTIDPDMLFAPPGTTGGKFRLPADEVALVALQPVLDAAAGTMVATVHGKVGAPQRWVDHAAGAVRPALEAAALTRRLDRSRSRWSFTAITSRDSARPDPWDTSIADEGADDEQRPPDVGLEHGGDATAGPGGTLVVADGETSRGSPVPVSPLAFLPAGAAFGTLAHEVLESTDFTAADLRAEVGREVVTRQAWRSLSLRPVGFDGAAGGDAAEVEGARLLTDGLCAVIDTPLGARLGGVRLGDIPPADRLDELGFDLLLAGAGAPANDTDIGHLVVAHLDADDPFRPWAEGLADGAFGVGLAGHLTGSIDAVIRVHPSGGPPRFVVVDYKTNRLHAHATSPRPGDYGPGSMVAAMAEHHYPLQALLYQVAVHRYLRWRLPGYDPAAHLGGAAYLFLRGMTGAAVRTEDGHPDGVCDWAVPHRLVTDLSDLLDGRRPGAPRGEAP